MKLAKLANVYHTRYVCNMKARPAEVEALLAKKVKKGDGKASEVVQIRGRTVWSNASSINESNLCVKMSASENLSVSQSPTLHNIAVNVSSDADKSKAADKVNK